MSKSRNRVVSWIVLMVFSIVIFCSSAFIIVHADHDCMGEDCSVCMELAQCHKTLHMLAAAVGGALQLTLMFCIVAALCNFIIILTLNIQLLFL